MNVLKQHIRPSKLLDHLIQSVIGLQSAGQAETARTENQETTVSSVAQWSPTSMKFGAFLAPYHPLDADPALQLRRDIDLMAHLDHLGFEEAWMGSTTRPVPRSSRRQMFSSPPPPSAPSASASAPV